MALDNVSEKEAFRATARHFLVFSCLLESYYFTGFVVFWLGCTKVLIFVHK
jgi:hypothetical protein